MAKYHEKKKLKKINKFTKCEKTKYQARKTDIRAYYISAAIYEIKS